MCGERLDHHLTVKHLFTFKPIDFPVTCTSCEDKFSLLIQKETDCKGCGRHLDVQSGDVYLNPQRIDNQAYCPDCARWLETIPSDILNHRAIFDYNKTLQEWIVKYKYEGDIRMAEIMVPFLRTAYRQYKDYQWIVLPSSPQSLSSRRFHPTGHLLDLADIPYQVVHNYIGDGVKQAHKKRNERIQMAQSFKLNDSISELYNKKWLIFDDVYTTGTTVNQAKKMLYHSNKQSGRIIRMMSLSIARDQLKQQ